MFGCGARSTSHAGWSSVSWLIPTIEHVQLLLSQSQDVMNRSISHYKMILRGIFDTTPLVPQTTTNLEGQAVTTITSNYLCLQCPTTVTEDDRLKHGNKKSHRFCAYSLPHGMRLLTATPRRRISERLPLLPDMR